MRSLPWRVSSRCVRFRLRPAATRSLPSFASRGSLRTANLDAVAGTVWMLVFAVGVLPAVLAYRPPLRWLRNELVMHRDITAARFLLGSVLVLATAPFSGNDVPRPAYPATVLLFTSRSLASGKSRNRIRRGRPGSGHRHHLDANTVAHLQRGRLRGVLPSSWDAHVPRTRNRRICGPHRCCGSP